MPMMSEEKLRRVIDTMTFIADFSPCDCHLCGPAHTMACRMGAASLRCTIETLRFVLGEEFRENSPTPRAMNDERLQKLVSEWIARGRK